ncbi:MAG: DNRLRE domain-containing protein, partial [Chloroflexi bacterium]|nr:DNRLRE domain-containing protein [Chloroflexota bacterium]
NGGLLAIGSYLDTAVTNGTTYYYVVTAENTATQESGYSSEANATPYSVLVAAATADAYVDEKRGTTNYGADTVLGVKSKSSQAQRSFVQFDVSSIPGGSTISSATLTLCATSVPAATRTYEVYQVTAGWVEGSVTWNSQPAVAASATASASTPASAGCMTWTVTADVQAWVDGTANNGWRISDSVETNNATATFRSREDGAVPAEQPKLDIQYS